MYEEKKTPEGRSVAIRLLVDMPWVVRAFFVLLLADLVAIAAFGFAHHRTGIAAFEAATTELISYLKLIVGAIIGALSAEAKGLLKPSEHGQRQEPKLRD